MRYNRYKVRPERINAEVMIDGIDEFGFMTDNYLDELFPPDKEHICESPLCDQNGRVVITGYSFKDRSPKGIFGSDVDRFSDLYYESPIDGNLCPGQSSTNDLIQIIYPE